MIRWLWQQIMRSNLGDEPKLFASRVYFAIQRASLPYMRLRCALYAAFGDAEPFVRWGFIAALALAALASNVSYR